MAATGLAAVVLVAAATWIVPLRMIGDIEATDAARARANIVVGVFAALTTLLVIPAIRALALALRARALTADGQIIDARRVAARARENAARVLGFALAALVVLGLVAFVLTNDAAIITTFLSWEQISRSAGEIMSAAWLNLWIAIVAEILILAWSLTVALVRLAPGRAMAPLRWLATAYVDVFRAIPLIILLYLVAFGIPIAEIPVLSDLPTSWLIVLGLTITTSAYVAEVFRAGIESVHWSQTAAAKSLGFSTLQTWRYVIVPQAVRRVVAPLLSYFVGLQKDTALVLVVGAIDAFGQAKIFAGNYFNLSSVTFVALVFIAVTIPQTRLVDYLLARDARKTGVRAL
ncbi:MAG TPA: amino acid ABC transporter permease [Solirubrobacteraceae bacterium]|nr:amino acid ABC transporter permease [Solirubrobacteraceae bacterium]